MRPHSDVWGHFTVVEWKDGCKVRVECKYCRQQYVPNVTKLKRHLHNIHPPAVGGPDSVLYDEEDVQYPTEAEFPPSSLSSRSSCSSQASDVSSTRGKKRTILEFVDRPWRQEEQAAAQKLHALACVLNCDSYNSMSKPHMQEFLRALRPQYKPPSDKTLHDILDTIDREISEQVPQMHRNGQSGLYHLSHLSQVMITLSSVQMVYLALDSWTDPSGLPVCGVAIGNSVGPVCICLSLSFTPLSFYRHSCWI